MKYLWNAKCCFVYQYYYYTLYCCLFRAHHEFLYFASCAAVKSVSRLLQVSTYLHEYRKILFLFTNTRWHAIYSINPPFDIGVVGFFAEERDNAGQHHATFLFLSSVATQRCLERISSGGVLWTVRNSFIHSVLRGGRNSLIAEVSGDSTTSPLDCKRNTAS